MYTFDGLIRLYTPYRSATQTTVQIRLTVLGLIAQGANNSQIVEKLVITDKTVRNHITSIFSKLQVADRAQAIIKAYRAGLG